MMVSGTQSQPAYSATRRAATSRSASVPSGKSHNGRSPRIGLYTHSISRPSTEAVASSGRFEASWSRPLISNVPLVRMCRTVCSSSALIPASGPVGSGAAGSAAGTAVVAVQPWTDVSFGIERIRAQRAGPTGGRDDQFGAPGEVGGFVERPEHPKCVRTVLPVLEHDVLADLLLAEREQLDDDLRLLAVP